MSGSHPFCPLNGTTGDMIVPADTSPVGFLALQTAVAAGTCVAQAYAANPQAMNAAVNRVGQRLHQGARAVKTAVRAMVGNLGAPAVPVPSLSTPDAASTALASPPMDIMDVVPLFPEPSPATETLAKQLFAAPALNEVPLNDVSQGRLAERFGRLSHNAQQWALLYQPDDGQTGLEENFRKEVHDFVNHEEDSENDRFFDSMVMKGISAMESMKDDPTLALSKELAWGAFAGRSERTPARARAEFDRFFGSVFDAKRVASAREIATKVFPEVAGGSFRVVVKLLGGKIGNRRFNRGRSHRIREWIRENELREWIRECLEGMS